MVAADPVLSQYVRGVRIKHTEQQARLRQEAAKIFAAQVGGGCGGGGEGEGRGLAQVWARLPGRVLGWQEGAPGKPLAPPPASSNSSPQPQPRNPP
jgi:hypothetical protein